MHGNHYGTPVKALEGALSRGLDVLRIAPLDALITHRSRDELHLAIGSPVTAAIKASDVIVAIGG